MSVIIEGQNIKGLVFGFSEIDKSPFLKFDPELLKMLVSLMPMVRLAILTSTTTNSLESGAKKYLVQTGGICLTSKSQVTPQEFNLESQIQGSLLKHWIN